MIALKELVQFTDSYLESHLIEDYCPNGLQIEGKSNISKLGTAVSASLQTIEQAVEQELDALIVHHGLFWKGDPYPITGSKLKKIELLLRNEISLIGYHLPLDVHPTIGNNWKAAQDLGWKQLTGFGKLIGPQFLGVKGCFDPIPTQEFRKNLENYYQHTAHVALGSKQLVTSAALISGGAHWEIREAVKAGVDCFITGSFDEPIWHIAQEENIHFFALGHSNTETIGPKTLGKLLESQFHIPCPFLDLPNPF